MDRDEVEVNKNAKRTRSIYVTILTEQAWPKRELFLVGLMQEIPSGQDARVANKNGVLT